MNNVSDWVKALEAEGSDQKVAPEKVDALLESLTKKPELKADERRYGIFDEPDTLQLTEDCILDLILLIASEQPLGYVAWLFGVDYDEVETFFEANVFPYVASPATSFYAGLIGDDDDIDRHAAQILASYNSSVIYGNYCDSVEHLPVGDRFDPERTPRFAPRMNYPEYLAYTKKAQPDDYAERTDIHRRLGIDMGPDEEQ